MQRSVYRCLYSLFSFFCIHSPLLCSNTTTELYFCCTSVAGLTTWMCVGSCPHITTLKTRLYFYILLIILFPQIKTHKLWMAQEEKWVLQSYLSQEWVTELEQAEWWLPGSVSFIFHSLPQLCISFTVEEKHLPCWDLHFRYHSTHFCVIMPGQLNAVERWKVTVTKSIMPGYSLSIMPGYSLLASETFLLFC